MRKFSNYKDLYYHFVSGFYLGVYKKNDRFPTQMELATTYNVAANSIKKVFKMLLDDGFITTDRSFGTHVLFDIDNPEHLAKVPMHCPDPQSGDIDTLIMPGLFIGHTVYHALMIAEPRQIADYLTSTETLIEKLKHCTEPLSLFEPLTIRICQNLNNIYTNNFVQFLMQEFIFIDRKMLEDKALCEQARTMTLDFYISFKQMLLDNRPQNAVELIVDIYRKLCGLQGLLVFSVVDIGRKVFAQQALYTSLVHKLFLSIIAKDMKKGDLLPTESELADRYGVSLITVRKAASVLKEIGLIDGERFVGTRMREDWDSPNVQGWLSEMLEIQHKQIADSIFAEYVFGTAVCSNWADSITDDIVDIMQQRLDVQWQGYLTCNAPLFMSEVFVAPIVKKLDAQVLSKCFYHVHEDLTKFLAVRLLQMSHGFNGTARVHLYATRAIEALRRHDTADFLKQWESAVLLNWELLRSALDNAMYCYIKTEPKTETPIP